MYHQWFSLAYPAFRGMAPGAILSPPIDLGKKKKRKTCSNYRWQTRKVKGVDLRILHPIPRFTKHKAICNKHRACLVFMFTAKATNLTGTTNRLLLNFEQAAVPLGWSENIHARRGQDYKRLAPLHCRPASEFVGSSDGSDWGRYLPTRTWPRKRSSQPGARGGHGAAVKSVHASCGSRGSDRGCSGGGRKRRRKEEATAADGDGGSAGELGGSCVNRFTARLEVCWAHHRPWAISPLQPRMVMGWVFWWSERLYSPKKGKKKSNYRSYPIFLLIYKTRFLKVVYF